ncbi:hypothetical protein MLD38_011566 [Melastoma candidum]|uniref:Uncharacterized protein n=1 Tax=Melastoma candidum TaxID=119954 RepID=A0ACB9R2W4_9MYRT|nr:hypothetical protein MLD38_011566 [Melastoma candidum]
MEQVEETIISLKSAIAEEESRGSFLEVFRRASLKAFVIGGRSRDSQVISVMLAQSFRALAFLLPPMLPVYQQ